MFRTCVHCFLTTVHAKRRRPDTALALLLPAHVAARSAALLSGMRCLRRFAAGTFLFAGLSVDYGCCFDDDDASVTIVNATTDDDDGVLALAWLFWAV